MLLFICCRKDSRSAGIAQSVVRRIGSAEVTSSILVASSKMESQKPIDKGFLGLLFLADVGR